MEVNRCSQRWKMHLPEFKHSRRCQSLTAKDCERDKAEKERDRYHTDRRYVMRKPLFTEEHTPLLKKTQAQELREKERKFGREKKQRPTERNLDGARKKLAQDNFSLSQCDTLLPFASIGEPSSPMGVSELRAALYHEGPNFESPFTGSRVVQRSLSSSILEIQRLSPPVRPQLTSTVLYPTYTPRSSYSRSTKAQLGWEGEGEEQIKPFSTGGHQKRKPMSHHQADYWACAIPKAASPSPNRHSTCWDPNKEYQAMLDYTYPLRPGQRVSELESSELQEDSLLQTDTQLQDSGIELDNICSSTSLSGLGSTVSWLGQIKDSNTIGLGYRWPDNKSFYSMPSSAVPLGMSLDSVDYFKDGCAMKSDRHHELSSDIFVHSTSVLAQSKCVLGEVDEEFRSLPEKLEVLQLLSRSVREVTAQLSRSSLSSMESLGPDISSVLSSITLSVTQDAKDKESEDTDERKDETSREETPAVHTAAHHGPSLAARAGSGERLTGSSLWEVEALLKQLFGGALSDGQSKSQEQQEQSDSLMQHVQVFCAHLQRLIQQLYKVAEKMELLASPTVDMDGVKSSLAEYQSLQREMSCHLPLASSVLHTGQLLLSCINTTSPVLRDTLLLIDKQSGVLQSQIEHLLSCILSAMNSLTESSQPSPVQQSRDRDQGHLGIQGCDI